VPWAFNLRCSGSCQWLLSIRPLSVLIHHQHVRTALQQGTVLSRVYIRCAAHGLFCIAGLDRPLDEGGVETIAGLKAKVYDRLMLRPNQTIRLTSWGRELGDADRIGALGMQVRR